MKGGANAFELGSCPPGMSASVASVITSRLNYKARNLSEALADQDTCAKNVRTFLITVEVAPTPQSA